MTCAVTHQAVYLGSEGVPRAPPVPFARTGCVRVGDGETVPGTCWTFSSHCPSPGLSGECVSDFVDPGSSPLASPLSSLLPCALWPSLPQLLPAPVPLVNLEPKDSGSKGSQVGGRRGAGRPASLT